ncbi:MAG: hypothetical protein C4539_12295 [Ignavibacteriales bacterium]|nr:MAG: hypothetical protein C4539_12295 [Ignavibacteriales bacterium]
MKKFLPALICGFVAGVLNIVPVVKSFSCCLIIPAAAVFALVLYQRAENNFSDIKAGDAAVFGLLTGIIAAIFGSTLDVLIIFITRTNEIAASLAEVEKMIDDLPSSPIWKEVMDVMYRISDDINKYGFSFIYFISVFVSSFIVNSIFGIAGGLLGMQILNNRNKNKEV